MHKERYIREKERVKEKIQKEAEFIQNEYPGLILDADNKNVAPSISGIIQLKDANGYFIENYNINKLRPMDFIDMDTIEKWGLP